MRELPLDPAALAAHDGFVRRLAARLATSEASAHDLAQDTWLAALASEPPEDASRLRAWLAGVLRNRRAFVLRTAARRADRETLVARARESAHDEFESTAQLVERMELHKRTVDAVLALPDELRTIVLLHFFERVPTAEIAARLGLPHGTVKSRLERALARLRAELRASFGGDSSAFVPAFACLARGGPPAPLAVATASLPLLGVLIMKSLAVLAAGLLLVLAASRAFVAAPSDESTRATIGEQRAEFDTSNDAARERDALASTPMAEARAPATPPRASSTPSASPSPSARLRVVDAATRADLRDVLVLRGVLVVRGHAAPGEWEPENVLAQGASPLALPDGAGEVSLWVGARGYGWSPLQVDFTSGGDREVRLAPAASLDVFVAGLRDDLDVSVRLYPLAATSFSDVFAERGVDPGGHALLEGVPAGACEVRAEVGMWYAPPIVLARANVELHAAERTEVVLELRHPLLDAPVEALAGEIRLPLAQAGLDVALRIRPVASAPLRKSDWARIPRRVMKQIAADVLAFDAGRVTPGRYVAIVDPVQFVQFFDVPAGGKRDLTLEVPALQRVDVTVVDRADGTPLRLDHIAWGVPSPRETRVWGFDNVKSTGDPGRFTFLAPSGTIGVTAFENGFKDETRWVEVGDGPLALRLELTRLFGVSVSFRDGAARVPAEWRESDFALRKLDADAELERGDGYELQLESGDWRVLVSEPGAYVLTFPEHAGFVRPEPRELTFVAGEVRPLEIALERAR